MDEGAKLGIALVIIAGLVLVFAAVSGAFDHQYTVINVYNTTITYNDAPILSALDDLSSRLEKVEAKPDMVKNVWMIEGTAPCVLNEEDSGLITFACKPGTFP